MQEQGTLRLQRLLHALHALVPQPYSPHNLPSVIAAYCQTITQLFAESAPAAHQPKGIEGSHTADAGAAADKRNGDAGNTGLLDEAMDIEEVSLCHLDILPTCSFAEGA